MLVLSGQWRRKLTKRGHISSKYLPMVAVAVVVGGGKKTEELNVSLASANYWIHGTSHLLSDIPCAHTDTCTHMVGPSKTQDQPS